jgi:RimJ/RimL family protein N-acetyltransferase
MFAKTKRLTLRPAWPEDAVPLVQAIGHEAVARMLRYVPFPYGLSDATAFCTQPRDAAEACFLIIAHDRAVPTLIGGIAIDRGDGDPLLGYWLTPSAWGRGYATEAGRAVIDMARHALPLQRLSAWHFADNSASGAVLRKLGFRSTGRTVMKRSVARADAAAAVSYDLDLDEQCEPMRVAA